MTAGSPLPQERQVTLWADGERYRTLYCTPRDLEDLAVGCLFAGGRLDPDRLPTLRLSEGEPWIIRADTKSGRPRPRRGSEAAPWPIPLERVVALADHAMKNSPLRREEGGLHAAALGWGKELLVREDVARHNAVDKVLGAGIIKGVGFGGAVLFTTGRLSHEMMVKAAAAGIPVVATMKYPTDLGVSLAERRGICVVGKVLSPEPEVYTGHWRLGLPDPE